MSWTVRQCRYVILISIIFILFLFRTAHGPDTGTFLKATAPEASLKPVYLDSGLAFMFETLYLLSVAPQALSSPHLQDEYTECWEKLPKIFDGTLDPWRK